MVVVLELELEKSFDLMTHFTTLAKTLTCMGAWFLDAWDCGAAVI